jgi:hypothetical protein
MLEALSAEEAAYYSAEKNVLDWEGKSSVIFDEFTEQFGFVAGSEAEYVSYFNRSDLPQRMWTWMTAASVRGIAGFSAVPKKNGMQRKLLMSCASNYAFADARGRANHGLYGGGALARLHVPSGIIEAASFDESNAFTSVLTPAWMWAWNCCPAHSCGAGLERAASQPEVRLRTALVGLPGLHADGYGRLALGAYFDGHQHYSHRTCTDCFQILGQFLTFIRDFYINGDASADTENGFLDDTRADRRS